MAKMLTSIKRFIGDSGEPKAMDCPNGSTFFEKDTGNMMVFQEGVWSLKDETGNVLRLEMIYRLDELLIQAKKTNEFLEVVASSVND